MNDSERPPLSEIGVPTAEAAIERVHSEEDILSLMLTRITGIKSIGELQEKIGKRIIDGKGLAYLSILSTDEDGDVIEYCYVRSGEHEKQGAAFANAALEGESRIDTIRYYKGVPCSSEQIAKFDMETGKWK